MLPALPPLLHQGQLAVQGSSYTTQGGDAVARHALPSAQLACPTSHSFCYLNCRLRWLWRTVTRAYRSRATVMCWSPMTASSPSAAAGVPCLHTKPATHCCRCRQELLAWHEHS